MQTKNLLGIAIGGVALAVAVFASYTMQGDLYKGFIGEKPASEEVPIPEKASIPEETPIPEEAPIPEETLIPEETPAVEEEPTTEEETIINGTSRGLMMAYLVKAMPNIDKDLLNKSEGCFDDVIGHKYENYICYTAEIGLLKEYADRTFRPENYINRAEAAKLIVQAFNIKFAKAKSEIYKDVSEKDWYHDYVITSVAYKIIPYDSFYFNPNDILKKEDAKTWVQNAMNEFGE